MVRGDTLTCGVKARYLHGGPMAGGGVSVVVTRRQSWFRAPGLEGFFLTVGFGGHGFQHSPATGRYVAEWLVDGRPSLDLSLFDPSRFEAGASPARHSGPDAE